MKLGKFLYWHGGYDSVTAKRSLMLIFITYPFIRSNWQNTPFTFLAHVNISSFKNFSHSTFFDGIMAKNGSRSKNSRVLVYTFINNHNWFQFIFNSNGSLSNEFLAQSLGDIFWNASFECIKIASYLFRHYEWVQTVQNFDRTSEMPLQLFVLSVSP